ncbi:MAG: bile acid:sodium symporter [Pseudomonadota bacterium]
MKNRLSLLADPMIAVLLLATVLALITPAVGPLRPGAIMISNIGIFVLFLTNGMRIPRDEIRAGIGNWRFFLPLFLFVFGAMSLAGLGLSMVAKPFVPPLVALGFLYLGTLPSTVQSATSYTSLAGGNIALSIVGAAFINIAGVFITAPLFAALGGSGAADIGYETILRIGALLILPFVIGQMIQSRTIDWLRARKPKVIWLDRIVIGIAVYVAMSGAVMQGLQPLFGTDAWVYLLVLVVAFLIGSNAGAWIVGGVIGLARPARIAFLFAGSQKSVAIGAPLAALMFPASAAGFVIAPLLLYHLLQLILAAPLSKLLANGNPAQARLTESG